MLPRVATGQETWAIGGRVGRYEILGRVGTGGMAELFLARARGLEGFEKLFVLKRMHKSATSDSGLVSLFLDEARIAAQLEHPNIVQVYDIGFSDESHYFAMEYVHGADVRRLFERASARGGLSVDAAITMVVGVLAGLQHAHEKRGRDGEPLGMVHRDVSPSNVLVSFDGAVKLADFGIAKVAARQSNTEAGLRRGKAAYMSPEQCRGERLDRRSDLFSLGIVLWELTTGRRMFGEQDPLVIMRAIADGDLPSPADVQPDYPKALSKIVQKALSRDAQDRFANAEAFQLALEEFARAERLAMSSVTLSRCMRSLFAEEVHAWEKAERDGDTLAHHLTQTREVVVFEPRPSSSSGLSEPSGDPKEPKKQFRAVWAYSAVLALALTMLAAYVGYQHSLAAATASPSRAGALASALAEVPVPPDPSSASDPVGIPSIPPHVERAPPPRPFASRVVPAKRTVPPNAASVTPALLPSAPTPPPAEKGPRPKPWDRDSPLPE